MSQRARLEAVASRIVSAAEAQDILQDAFVLCLKHGHKFRGEAKPSTWLYRLTVNVALQRLRKEKRRPVSTLEDADLVVSPGPGSDASVFRREAREQLDLALAGLSNVDRRVVWMRLVEEESTSETARELGVSEAAVKTRLCRARAALGSALESQVHA